MNQTTDIAMRDAFLDSLYDLAIKDHNIIFVSADCGAPSLDKFRQNLADQYFTVGIAEQNMISIAAGLAIEGKIAYTYAIAPFASLRCYEQIKVNLCCMNLPVTVLGIGAGFAYDIMGPTHHATEDISIMRALPEITILNPSDSTMAGALAKLSYELPGPKYIRFDRGDLPRIYENGKVNLSEGLTEIKEGKDLCIVATGNMVKRALEVADSLSKHSINVGVVDLFRIKPINEELLLKIIEKSDRTATLEEHFITGGIGSIIAEILVDRNKHHPLLRLGIPHKYFFEYGGRQHLHTLTCLDVKNLTKILSKWMSK